MCNPLMAAGIALTVAQTGAQFIGQRQEAEAQEDYQKRLMDERQTQIEENYKRTLTAYNMQTSGELSKLEETKMATRSKEFDIRREALRRQAAQLSAASSMGASGNSLMVGLLDTMAQAGFDISALNVNAGLEEDQTNRNLKAFHEEAKARATSIQPYTPSPIYRPSGLGAALTIGSGAFDAYTRYQMPRDQATKLTT